MCLNLLLIKQVCILLRRMVFANILLLWLWILEIRLLSSLEFGAGDGWLSSFYSCLIKKVNSVQLNHSTKPIKDLSISAFQSISLLCYYLSLKGVFHLEFIWWPFFIFLLVLFSMTKRMLLKPNLENLKKKAMTVIMPALPWLILWGITLIYWHAKQNTTINAVNTKNALN